jgi:GTP-binding protein Era
MIRPSLASHVQPEYNHSMDNTSAQEFRSGFIAVMGRPNVGKSTLINSLLKQKVAAVSPRPQTTRRRQLGILTLPHAQMIFIDTPGVHNPRHKLGEKMNEDALQALQHTDLIAFIVDGSEPPTDEDSLLAAILNRLGTPHKIVIIVNKIDQLDEAALAARQAAYLELIPGASILGVSATRGDGLPELLDFFAQRLPVSDAYYPEEQVTDLYEREIASDLIREACLVFLREEIPHGIAVRIDDFQERGEEGAYIQATLILERESHKGIVIGQGGSMLKKIGSAARKEIEAMSGRKVFLDLRVKVRKNWRDDEKAVKQLFQ